MDSKSQTQAGISEAQCVGLLRLSIGLIFCWFGALKLFPGVSPAESIAGRTIEGLSFGLIQPWLSLPGLALFEVSIGALLIAGIAPRLTPTVLVAHMIGTFTPALLFPDEVFQAFLVPTLLGQYIIKNIVLIAGALVISSTQIKPFQSKFQLPRRAQ